MAPRKWLRPLAGGGWQPSAVNPLGQPKTWCSHIRDLFPTYANCFTVVVVGRTLATDSTERGMQRGSRHDGRRGKHRWKR